MNKKKLLIMIFIALAVVIVAVITSLLLDYPSGLSRLIQSKQLAPVTNPPSSITKCEYKKQVVYYIPPSCCDIPGGLYNKWGFNICSPDGGLTGNGDGKCSDFFQTKQNCGVVWKDTR